MAKRARNNKKKSHKIIKLSLNDFQKGDLVFAKIKGFQFWPSVLGESIGTKVRVDFFDYEKTWALVSADFLKPFSLELCEEMLVKHHKNLKLVKAINEIKTVYNGMQKQVAEKAGRMGKSVILVRRQDEESDQVLRSKVVPKQTQINTTAKKQVAVDVSANSINDIHISEKSHRVLFTEVVFKQSKIKIDAKDLKKVRDMGTPVVLLERIDEILDNLNNYTHHPEESHRVSRSEEASKPTEIDTAAQNLKKTHKSLPLQLPNRVLRSQSKSKQ